MTHEEYVSDLVRMGVPRTDIINSNGCCVNSVAIRFGVHFFTNHDLLVRNGYRAIGGGDGGMIFRK